MNAIELYESASGEIILEVRAGDDTVWLTRQQMAALFGRDVKTIGKHIANARNEELSKMSVVAKFATTASDGKSYQTEHYNVDAVLSVGYRVKSSEGVHFRRWATDVLHRYVELGQLVTRADGGADYQDARNRVASETYVHGAVRVSAAVN